MKSAPDHRESINSYRDPVEQIGTKNAYLFMSLSLCINSKKKRAGRVTSFDPDREERLRFTVNIPTS